MPETPGPAHILVVEDEASLARGIAFNLEVEGYLVDCIADGQEASDLLSVKGYPTTWGAKPLAAQTFDYDATVIRKLRDAGAVLVG